MKYFLALIVLIPLIGFVFCLYYLHDCTEIAVDETRFVIDKPYRQVVLSMAKPDTTGQIVAANKGKIIKQDGQDLTFNLERIIRPVWNASGCSELVIEQPVPYGRVQLEFHQDIKVNQDEMITKMSLKKPAHGISECENITIVRKINDKQTEIYLKNSLTVTHRLPLTAHDYMKEEVRKNNESTIKNTEACLKQICGTIASVPLIRSRKR